MKFQYFTNTDSEADVRHKYKKLAKKYHPDKAKDDADREHFHKIMQEINAEHQEILVLLKYEALRPNREKNKDTKPKNAIKDTINLFKLNEKQQNELFNKGRDIWNFVYESVVENIQEKIKSN